MRPRPSGQRFRMESFGYSAENGRCRRTPLCRPSGNPDRLLHRQDHACCPGICQAACCQGVRGTGQDGCRHPFFQPEDKRGHRGDRASGCRTAQGKQGSGGHEGRYHRGERGRCHDRVRGRFEDRQDRHAQHLPPAPRVNPASGRFR